VVITHNARGYCGPDPAVAGSTRRRLAALGGSTTYCVGLSDEDTWAAQLSRELGGGVDVLNLGIPGYTTAENLIQSSFELPDLTPSVAVYYEGWNDLRNAHVPDLDPYYADFHGRFQPTNVGLSGPYGRYSALWFYGSLMWRRAFDRVADESANTAIDWRALDLFTRNLRAIVAVDRARGIEPVLVQQIVNCGVIPNVSSSTPWIPFVPQRELCADIREYNEQLAAIGRDLAAPVVSTPVASVAFTSADFADFVHFNVRGPDDLRA
jgi:hypothetical protein